MNLCYRWWRGAVLPALVLTVVVYSVPAAEPETEPAAKRGKKTQTVLPPAPPGVRIEQNLDYLEPGRKEKLDLYLPADRPSTVRSPAVVIIHGGGWTGGDKAAGREFNIGTTLALAGYVCASVEYLKQGRGRWPTNLFDCKNAVRFLRKNAERYQIDTGHIGVIGGSAGGHLALMVAYTTGVESLSPPLPYPGVSDSVSACVDMYGIANLLTRQKTDPSGKPTGDLREAGLFSDRREEAPDKWKLASPVYHISSNSPPTLILHGTADSTVDHEQSKELAAKLAANGVEHRLMLIPQVGHTFDLQTWQRKPLPEDLRPVVVGFFDQHLRRSAKPGERVVSRAK